MIEVIEKQRLFFRSNETKDLSRRIAQLRTLRQVLQANEEAFFQAIEEDFGKSRFETYMTELAMIYSEIGLAIKKLTAWGRPQRVLTGLTNFPARSYIVPEPFGTSLIIGAWNYPYQLTLVPLVSALAAGNTVILKPSDLPSQTAAVLANLLNSHFPPEWIFVVQGGAETTAELLEQKFDKIFFTGSTRVGRLVALAAAKHLTPVTLELGGKSPCIVMKDADLQVSARRILWGKFLNAGQTCIAPDYVVVERFVYEEFLRELKEQLPTVRSATRIINAAHTERLKKLIDPTKTVSGGKVSGTLIEPTILRDIEFSDEIMKEEVFGPLLPVLPFSNLDHVVAELKSRPRPLAFYLFTKDKRLQKRLVSEVEFGGGAINDVLMQVANHRLPFGGVGASGMGSYHGEAGFKAFSHFKSVLIRNFGFEPSFKYPPHSPWKMRLLKVLSR